MIRRLLFCLCVLTWSLSAGEVHLALDTSEADRALAILTTVRGHREVTGADWKALFATDPYRWLKDREASMGRSFSDDDFKQFLQSRNAASHQAEWEAALHAMKSVDMRTLGERALEWLPPGASINARVFPEIKPHENSFVWTQKGQGPAIFLYLAKRTSPQFENTVAHECHHIGLQSLEAQQTALEAVLAPNVRTALHWMGGFGEGEAMLAAAGSDDRHPHWEDDAGTRARWDGDMMHFDSDLAALQQFFIDILDGKLQNDPAIAQRAAPFWGDAQGAWYTVGYEMAVLVDKQFGRATLNQCLIDPRKLLVFYNQIALAENAKGARLATWSPAFLARLNATR